MAERNRIEFLGSLPLDINIRQFADCGRPTVVADPDGRAGANLQANRPQNSGKTGVEGQGLYDEISQDRRAKYVI